MTDMHGVALLIAAGMFVMGGAWAAPAGGVPETDQAGTMSVEAHVVAARVNGIPIYDEDVSLLAGMHFRKFQRSQSDKPTPELWADMRKQAIQDLIAVELISQAGREMDIPGSGEKTPESPGGEKQVHGGQSGGRADQGVRDPVKRSLLIKEYLRRTGVTDPEIPEARIRDYYNRHKEHFRREAFVHVRHILIRVNNEEAGPDERAEARTKIEQVQAEILGGRDFAGAAREYSEDNAASAGGDIGYIERGFMPPPFDEIAFSIDRNTLSSVIETRFGYHLLEVLDRVPAGVPEYRELRGFIERYLKMEKSKEKKAELVENLRAGADIEILLP